uniref:Uncharacterized protein n=1 Tax=Setaria digitata TaxID=48799 RepID=A0A915PJE1_9BILA
MVFERCETGLFRLGKRFTPEIRAFSFSLPLSVMYLFVSLKLPEIRAPCSSHGHKLYFHQWMGRASCQQEAWGEGFLRSKRLARSPSLIHGGSHLLLWSRGETASVSDSEISGCYPPLCGENWNTAGDTASSVCPSKSPVTMFMRGCLLATTSVRVRDAEADLLRIHPYIHKHGVREKDWLTDKEQAD